MRRLNFITLSLLLALGFLLISVSSSFASSLTVSGYSSDGTNITFYFSDLGSYSNGGQLHVSFCDTTDSSSCAAWADPVISDSKVEINVYGGRDFAYVGFGYPETVFYPLPENILHGTPTSCIGTCGSTPVFTDDFTDTNGTSLSTHNTSWNVTDGSAEIQNNKLLSHGVAAFLPNYLTTDSCISSDVDFPLSSILYLFLRVSGSGNSSYYYTFINPVDNTHKIGWLNGNQGYIGSVDNIVPSQGSHNFKFCVNGSTITSYLDNNQLASANDSHITGPGSAGILIAGQNDVIDNFKLESFQIGSTPTPTIINTPTPTPISNTIKVKVWWPLDNSRVYTNTKVAIVATVNSKKKIKKVEFYINNVLTCTDTKMLYTCIWKVPNKKGMTYSIVIKAYDIDGNVGQSKLIKVTSK